MISVAVFDPGVTTGWCRWSIDGAGVQGMTVGEAVHAGKLVTGDSSVYAATFDGWIAEQAWARDQARKTVQWWNGEGELFVVIEDFLLRREGTAQRATLSPVRLTAFLEANLMYQVSILASHKSKIRSRRLAMIGRFQVVGQTPAQAKSYATDDRLRHWDLWVKGSPHQRDALRHLCLFLAGYSGR